MAGGVIAIALAFMAGCGGDAEEELPAVEGPTSPNVELRATEMSYDPEQVAVQAGEVEVVLHNEGSMLHDVRLEDEPLLVEANAGETATEQVSLEPGSYQYFCSVPGHREAGMEGVLEVRE